MVSDDCDNTVWTVLHGTTAAAFATLLQTPVLVCSTAPPGENPPRMSSHISNRNAHRAATRLVFGLWGEELFKDCRFVATLAVASGGSEVEITPKPITPVPTLADGKPPRLRLVFHPNTSGHALLWVCLSMVDDQGRHTPLDEHLHHVHVIPGHSMKVALPPEPSMSAAATEARDQSHNPPYPDELPPEAVLVDTRQGLGAILADANDHGTEPHPPHTASVDGVGTSPASCPPEDKPPEEEEPVPAETQPSSGTESRPSSGAESQPSSGAESQPSGEGEEKGWIQRKRILKVCVRPSLRAMIAGEVFPPINKPADVYKTRFADAFPRLVASSGKAWKQEHRKKPIWFEGLTGSPVEVKTYAGAGYNDAPVIRTSETIDFDDVDDAAYGCIASAYGNHEGGFTAIQTYDGPKISIGWTQSTFVHNYRNQPPPAKKRKQERPNGWEGYGWSFFCWFAAAYPAVFDELFGRYGYRVSRATSVEPLRLADLREAFDRSTWGATADAAQRRIPAVYVVPPDIWFWRLPCCEVTALETAPLAGWRVMREETRTVGFVALIVQAMGNSGFLDAQKEWTRGMMELAFAEMGQTRVKAGALGLHLRNSVIRPGKVYSLDNAKDSTLIGQDANGRLVLVTPR